MCFGKAKGEEVMTAKKYGRAKDVLIQKKHII